MLIDDPVTSYMKKEYIERFRCLSGIDDLKIDVKKCLSYRDEHQKSGEETEPMRTIKREKQLAGTMCNRNERSAAMFQKTYIRRQRSDPKPISTFSSNLSTSKKQNEESTSEGPRNMDGPVRMPVIAPKMQDCPSKKSIILTGTVRKGRTGPQVGVVDIGISRSAYFFQVSLPSVFGGISIGLFVFCFFSI